MDVILTEFTPLSTIYNILLIPGVVLSATFILLVIVHTPKYMIIYKYTLLNTSIWSLLIIVHMTFIFRPVTFLPLPICAVTGIAKYFGWTFASCQLLIGLLLVANKALALLLCVASNYFCLAFPLYVRQLPFKKGLSMYLTIHTVVSLIMIGTAVFSYGDRQILDKDEIIHKLRDMYPTNAEDILEITNSSVMIGVRNVSLSSFASGFFLFLSCLSIVISLAMMYMCISTINGSFTKISTKKFVTTRSRLKSMIVQRTLLPIFTYSLPVTIAVTIVHFNLLKLAGCIQWLLLCAFVSPFVCTTVTTLSLPNFRKAARKMLYLKIKEVMAKSSDPDSLEKKTSILTLSPGVRHYKLRVVH